MRRAVGNVGQKWAETGEKLFFAIALDGRPEFASAGRQCGAQGYSGCAAEDCREAHHSSS